MSQVISMVFAMDKNRTIGSNNQLPWRLPADLAYFKKVTMGHPVVMGRKTHESIGKPLPGRQNVILTKNREYSSEGCIIVHSVEDVLHRFQKEAEVCIIGGSEIFKLFLPTANRLHITHIDYEFDGDAFFPEIHPEEWVEVSRKQGVTDEKNPYTYFFVVYDKKK